MIPALAAAMLATAPAQVELRGAEAPPPGRVMAVGPAGVTMTQEPGSVTNPAPSILIGWDRVRAVTGAFAGAAEPFGTVAEGAWRARARLERGDAPGAEPIFEALFPQVSSRPGPTAALVAEGLLRCRLRRGAHIAVVEPWLVLRRTSAAAPAPWMHADWATEAGLAAVLDPQTRLVPAIPPMWVGNTASRSLSGLTAAPAGADEPGAALAALYAAAAKFEAGENVPVPPVTAADPGVAFVAEIVASRIAGPSEREAARRALQERLGRPDAPAWSVAWCRAAIGRSMILDPDPTTRQLGVVELLRLPAEMPDVHPYLTGLALAEASVALRAAGDDAGADTLRDELYQRYPGHPVLDWPPIIARTVPRAQRTP